MAQGAIAATVAHDHHNIVAVGVDYDDLALAANRLSEIEGGFVVAQGGRVLAELPFAGRGADVAGQLRGRPCAAGRAARGGEILGVTLEEPFLQLAFIALPVIPHLKITDHGMVDVDKFEVI